jgi:hypothetical protein
MIGAPPCGTPLGPVRSVDDLPFTDVEVRLRTGKAVGSSIAGGLGNSGTGGVLGALVVSVFTVENVDAAANAIIAAVRAAIIVVPHRESFSHGE